MRYATMPPPEAFDRPNSVNQCVCYMVPLYVCIGDYHELLHLGMLVPVFPLFSAQLLDLTKP